MSTLYFMFLKSTYKSRKYCLDILTNICQIQIHLTIKTTLEYLVIPIEYCIMIKH